MLRFAHDICAVGRRSGQIVFVTLLLAACCGCKKAKPETIGDACLVQCQLRAKELGCSHPEGCEAPCAALREAAACTTQLRAFENCFLKLPRERWECGDDGVPIPNGHTCESEKGYVEDCLLRTNGKL